MSEPRICPFRNAGVMIMDETGLHYPVYHDAACGDEPILGIACCEEKCQWWVLCGNLLELVKRLKGESP